MTSTDQHETVVEGDKLSRQVFAGMVDGKVLLHYITYIEECNIAGGVGAIVWQDFAHTIRTYSITVYTWPNDTYKSISRKSVRCKRLSCSARQ